MSFALFSFYVIDSVSYIIKISVESRAWLFFHDPKWIKEKRKNKKKQRDHMSLMESNELTQKEYDE